MIEIGSNVSITEGVTILTHGYDWSIFKGRDGWVLGSAGHVKIGDNVFIGMNATILKGVEIGDNVIIGAGSVVTKSIPANSVAVGNPARVKCDIDSYLKKREEAQLVEAADLYIHTGDEILRRANRGGYRRRKFSQSSFGCSKQGMRNFQTPRSRRRCICADRMKRAWRYSIQLNLYSEAMKSSCHH
jgi:carbonic anhydrase/acetyltransferase-like protein (isoleucine patch superfamily)